MKNYYENPEIQSLNRLPMRSHLIPFADAKSALQECAEGPESREKSASSFVKYLDGKWKFALLDSPDNESSTSSKGHKSQNVKNWQQPDFNADSWEEITVPGTWTLQGWDKPHYTNVQMPFDTLPPNVPHENPTGLYRLSVKIPSEWKKRRVVIHIGSAESVLQLFVNGIEAGISKDTRLPCEFDITSYIGNAAESGKEVVIAIKVI